MDVFNNLAFGLRRRGVARQEIERRVQAVAVQLGLDPYLRRKPHALSGGQRQRVALGRAIVREPKVFLFDEPLSNLDAALRLTTRNELIRQQREIGITAIYVTHDQLEAMTMGHRICIMNKGEVVQIGAPLEVYRNPANTFVAKFLGSPPMNLLPVRTDAGPDGYRFGVGGTAWPADAWAADAIAALGGHALIGIRPEDLYGTTPRPGDNRIVPLPATTVAAVEPLGAETLVVLTLDGLAQEVIARVGRDTKLRPGDAAAFMVDTVAMHVFDTRTMRSIPRNKDRGRGQASG
jgi:multiple sugar transport system ATP-binding protein